MLFPVLSRLLYKFGLDVAANQGVGIASGAPDVTTAKLYQVDGKLCFDGKRVSATDRVTIEHTSISLDSSAVENFTLTLPKSFVVSRMIANYPTRLRIYYTSEERAADANRIINFNPSWAANCAYEGITSDTETNISALAIASSPTSSNTFYLSLQNIDTSTHPITITLNLLTLEP